jgi:hypothetical protein
MQLKVCMEVSSKCFLILFIEVSLSSDLNENFTFSDADSFGAHKAFAHCPKQSKLQLAGRLIDGITTDLGERLIECAQLAVLILLLPFKALKKDAFSTFRVELIVRMYSNIADKCNFDRITRLLQPMELGMLIFRLGSLIMFSPFRPQGSYLLNLSNPEERLLARVLFLMQRHSVVPPLDSSIGSQSIVVPAPTSNDKEKQKEQKEPNLNKGLWSDISIQSEYDRNNRQQFNSVPGYEWEVPEEWELDASLPYSGTLRFTYYPGSRLQSLQDLNNESIHRSGNRISVLDIVNIKDIRISSNNNGNAK